jgi:hypothetical protein
MQHRLVGATNIGSTDYSALTMSYSRASLCWHVFSTDYTVRKIDLILRSIERMLQTQLSMARRFKLQVLRRYNVKFSKMRNFTLDTQRLDKLKSTGGRRTNNPWISSPGLYHCATGTREMKAEFYININTFCHN